MQFLKISPPTSIYYTPNQAVLKEIQPCNLLT